MDNDRVAAAAIELETAARVVYKSLTEMHDCWLTEVRALDGALSSFRGARNTASETHTYSDTDSAVSNSHDLISSWRTSDGSEYCSQATIDAP